MQKVNSQEFFFPSWARKGPFLGDPIGVQSVPNADGWGTTSASGPGVIYSGAVELVSTRARSWCFPSRATGPNQFPPGIDSGHALGQGCRAWEGLYTQKKINIFVFGNVMGKH